MTELPAYRVFTPTDPINTYAAELLFREYNFIDPNFSKVSFFNNIHFFPDGFPDWLLVGFNEP